MRKPKPAPLVVRRVRGMGRGVFAGRPFRAGELLEVCPVLVLPAGTPPTALGRLDAYVFKWADDALAIALGYGSLYNHSTDPNAVFSYRFGRDEVVFRAVRGVAAGEQIFIDYGWAATDYDAFRKAG
jgi:hypothetical protein